MTQSLFKSEELLLHIKPILKAGDRVCVIENQPPHKTVGLTGTVVAVINFGVRTYIGVDHDEPFHGCHTLSCGAMNYARKGNGLWYRSDYYLQKMFPRRITSDDLASII